MFNRIHNKTRLIVLKFKFYELQGLKVESIKFYIRWTLTAVDKQQ